MSPTRMSRIESAIRVVLQFNEAFNRHDVAGLARLVSDDCVVETNDPSPDGTVYEGKEIVIQFWQKFFDESPQGQMEIDEIFGFGERCVMRWRYNLVDNGGEERHIRGIDVFRVRDGRICEELSYIKR